MRETEPIAGRDHREKLIRCALLDRDREAMEWVAALYDDSLRQRLTLGWRGSVLDTQALDDVIEKTWSRFFDDAGSVKLRGEQAVLARVTRIAGEIVRESAPRRGFPAELLSWLGASPPQWPAADLAPVSSPVAAATVSPADRWEHFEQAFRRLSRAERAVIYWSYFEGRDFTEITRELCGDPSATHAILSRARAALGRLLAVPTESSAARS